MHYTHTHLIWFHLMSCWILQMCASLLMTLMMKCTSTVMSSWKTTLGVSIVTPDTITAITFPAQSRQSHGWLLLAMDFTTLLMVLLLVGPISLFLVYSVQFLAHDTLFRTNRVLLPWCSSVCLSVAVLLTVFLLVGPICFSYILYNFLLNSEAYQG